MFSMLINFTKIIIRVKNFKRIFHEQIMYPEEEDHNGDNCYGHCCEHYRTNSDQNKKDRDFVQITKLL